MTGAAERPCTTEFRAGGEGGRVGGCCLGASNEEDRPSLSRRFNKFEKKPESLWFPKG